MALGGGGPTSDLPAGPRGESPAKASVGLDSFGPNPTANLVGAEEGGSAWVGSSPLSAPRREGAGRGSGGFWCGTGPWGGAPRPLGPLSALPRRLVGELPLARGSDGSSGGRRATSDHLSLPHAEVRLQPRRLPLGYFGVDSGRPTRRGAVPYRGNFRQSTGLHLRGDERVHHHWVHATLEHRGP